MSRLRFLFSTSLLSLLTAWSAAALADVPPEDACKPTASVGSTCNVAGPNFDQPGICASAMCQHVGEGADGGLTMTEEPCVLCVGGSSSSGGGSTSGSTSSGISSASDASSCSVGVVGREGAITGTVMLVGLAALLADRRRRRS